MPELFSVNCVVLELVLSILHATPPTTPSLYKKEFQGNLEILHDDIKRRYFTFCASVSIPIMQRVNVDTIYNFIGSQKRMHLRHVTQPLPFKASNKYSEK